MILFVFLVVKLLQIKWLYYVLIFFIDSHYCKNGRQKIR